MGRTTGPSTAALRAGVAGAAPASGGCRWAVVLGDRRHVLRAPQVGPAVREYPLSGRPAHRAVCAAGCRALLQRVAPAPGDSAPSRRLWRDGVDVGTVDPCAARSRPRAFGRARALPLPGRRTGIAHAVAGRRAGSAHRAPR
ncbi:hypothetical protein ACIRPX_33705 [Streptomyces sp. NPDC101225]|uniref:hypothetical protein n=1 Tax=Streptomyces sp. NPDC101225 TaxID=3366135 RepID=UPI00382A58DE